MGFFDTLGETITSTGKVVGSKTKEAAETAKLNLQIAQEEARLKKAYEALGEAYFKNHENDMPEQYAVYAVDIRESAARLDSLMKDKQILKNQKRCAKCGAWMPNEDRFCGKCGAENEILVKETKAKEARTEEAETETEEAGQEETAEQEAEEAGQEENAEQEAEAAGQAETGENEKAE